MPHISIQCVDFIPNEATESTLRVIHPYCRPNRTKQEASNQTKTINKLLEHDPLNTITIGDYNARNKNNGDKKTSNQGTSINLLLTNNNHCTLNKHLAFGEHTFIGNLPNQKK
eukprot:675877_1